MIVVDLETTGLDSSENSIASIGAVDFTRPSRVFYKECKIPDDSKISKEALEVTGFTIESLRDEKKPSVESIVRDFRDWCNSANVRILAGENPWLDASFLRVAFNQYKIHWPFGHRLVDLHSISYAHHLQFGLPIPSNDNSNGFSLDQTLEYLGLKPRNSSHNSLNDAKLEAEAFSRFIYGRSLFKEYEQFVIPEPIRTFLRRPIAT